jgi:hypothetical protein
MIDRRTAASASPREGSIGEFDQGEIGAFAIGYWGFERKCIPDNKSNRECILVSKRFDMGAIIDRAGGVIANKANAGAREHPPTEGPLQIIPGTKNAGQVSRACAQVDVLVERFRRWCRCLDVPGHEADSQIPQLAAGPALSVSGARRVHLSQRKNWGQA